MSDPASTRPRPRPRPRPVPKPKSPPKASASSQDAGTSAAAAGPSTISAAQMADDALDAMFMKNTNRTLQTWSKLEEMKKGDKEHDVGSSSESDEAASPRSRKRHRKKVEALPVPKWQKDADLLRMLSAPPEDSEPEVEIEVLTDEELTPSKANGKGKRKRQPVRSRSITPPPMIPQTTVDNVKRFIEQAIGESTNSRREGAEEPREPTPLTESTRATRALDEGDVVVITVAWKPHPQDGNGQEMQWQYMIKRNESFHELFEAIAEDARIRVESLVVCHSGRRIFASVSPSSLGIWSDEVEFTAYTTTAFDYIRSHPELNSQSGLNSQQPQTQAPHASGHGGSGAIELSDDDDDTRPAARHARDSNSQSQSQFQNGSQTQQAADVSAMQSDAEDEDDNKFKITLKSIVTGNKEIVLTVRPTTKCGNILRKFLEKAGLKAEYPQVFSDTPAAPPPKARRGRGKAAAPAPTAKDPRLCVDGDKLDNEDPISVAELEDGDMVEVVGL